MTSNQIAYWRDEETRRTNRAQEAERYRHNLEQEKIDQVRNDLTAKGLEIQSNQQMLDLAEMVAKYGYTSLNQLNPEAKDKLAEIFGINVTDLDAGSGVASWWEEIKDTFRAIGGLKGIGSLF